VKEFSPFGSVDTLGLMTIVGRNELRGTAGGPAEAPAQVLLQTPTGKPMAGVPVNFTFITGGGSFATPNAVTGANGIASSGTWTLSSTVGCSRANATAVMTPGSGLTGNPALFFGCGR
jgi:hypothetical protein